MCEPIYCAVGELVLRSAAVERSLDALCWVLKNRRQGPFETTGLPLSVILKRLEAFAEVEDAPLRQELLSITSRVSDLKETRNHLIHGLWTGGSGSDSWQVSRALKNNPIPQSKEFSAAAVLDLKREYEGVQDKIIELHLGPLGVMRDR